MDPAVSPPANPEVHRAPGPRVEEPRTPPLSRGPVVIEARGLRKQYGRIVAVRDVTFDVCQGEISGSGLVLGLVYVLRSPQPET